MVVSLTVFLAFFVTVMGRGRELGLESYTNGNGYTYYYYIPDDPVYTPSDNFRADSDYRTCD